MCFFRPFALLISEHSRFLFWCCWYITWTSIRLSTKNSHLQFPSRLTNVISCIKLLHTKLLHVSSCLQNASYSWCHPRLLKLSSILFCDFYLNYWCETWDVHYCSTLGVPSTLHTVTPAWYWSWRMFSLLTLNRETMTHRCMKLQGCSIFSIWILEILS